MQAIYNHKPSALVRKYADAPTHNLYEFGYGLSYSQFEYSDARLSNSKIAQNESTKLFITVKNIGQYAGDEVVQLYIRDKFSQVTRPVKELKGFQRVSLKPGEERAIDFEITPDMLAYYNLQMNWVVEPGDFKIMVGGSSRNKDLKSINLKVKNN
jgi:beta-glucosidase